MLAELAYQIIDLILALNGEGKGIKLEAQDVKSILNQKANLGIKEVEIFDNNKYFTFVVDKSASKTHISYSPLSIAFWDRSANIPIDCVLFFKNGYIDSLEIYSCDGVPFDDIDMGNIDIMEIHGE